MIKTIELADLTGLRVRNTTGRSAFTCTVIVANSLVMSPCYLQINTTKSLGDWAVTYRPFRPKARLFLEGCSVLQAVGLRYSGPKCAQKPTIKPNKV